MTSHVDIHPIDIAEELADSRAWECDRMSDDQLAMTIQGQWCVCSITLAWNKTDETLCAVCTFEMDSPEEKLPILYECINLVNEQFCWAGAFSYWKKQKLMTYKYGLLLSGEQVVSSEQVEAIVATATQLCDRFRPVFELVLWSDKVPDEALRVAINQPVGRA